MIKCRMYIHWSVVLDQIYKTFNPTVIQLYNCGFCVAFLEMVKVVTLKRTVWQLILNEAL